MSELDFVENVLNSFSRITDEIEKSSSEHDVRYKFVKYFVERVLGYEPKYIKWEKKRADLTIIDENNFSVIKIETKRPTENIDKIKHEEQAFKYEEQTTRFIGLTNFLQFKLWEVKRTKNELRVNLDFSKILEKRGPIEHISSEEKSQILFLNNLTKDVLFDPNKYEKFDETYARIDITKDAGFRRLLDRLNFIVNNLLLGYTLKAFGEYKEGYSKYQAEFSNAERESKNNKGNHELNHGIAKYRQKLEEKYKKYITFSGYELWKQYSGKEDVPDDEIKEIFCKETIYVLLNKLIFIRICEDKNFLEKNISNGGIEELRAFLKKRFDKDVINKEILEMAFKSASGLYSHFYEVGILDWFRTGDGELNELLNRVLWILNQFDFAHVDRDILGNLYEKYLPSGERKKLGEFYTPTEVIDYILTSVGYTYSYDIETKELLDSACGSGGFLVRASRRLISRYLIKFRKTDKRELRDPKNWKEIVSRLSSDEAKIILESLQDHIYGLDINPFACHIAEMNLLFQIIDLYQKVREEYPDYKLKRFKVYRTDSLEKPTQKQIIDFTHSAFLKEQDEIDSIKEKKFDFVVGNPPYVRVQMLDEKTKEYINKNYSSDTGNFDLYVVFIERGLNWLKPKGNFGYIVSNKFTQSSYGIGIRKYILKNCRISRIIDFGDSGVFKDVTNYPLIFIGQHDSPKDQNRFTFIKVLKPREGIIDDIWKNFSKRDFKSEFMEVFEVDQSGLNETAWAFSNPHVQKITNKINKVSNKLYIKNFARPHRCLYTGLNEAFIVTEETIRQERLEKELIKKVVGGRDIQRWKINWRNQHIIYPYKQIGGNLQPINLKEYPNIKRHLEQFKDKLMARWFIKKIKKDDREQRWFEYADPRNIQQFENVKIITPDISIHNRFSLDFDKVYSLNTSYVIDLDNFKHEPKYLLGLLNSSLLEFFFKQISPFISGGYYRYINQYLEQLPIKLPETADEKKIADRLIKKVNEILELHKSGIVDIDAVLHDEGTEKLHQLPRLSFNISENAKFEKIRFHGNKIYINSQDFVEIKDKKIRDFVGIYFNFNSERLAKSKDVKKMILNISVPESDEVLKEIINRGGVDQSRIKEKIKGLENEINEMVYQIYGINKEEQKIIEESLK